MASGGELEVERKFLVTREVEAALRDTAVLHGQSSFTRVMLDTYWDTGPVVAGPGVAAAAAPPPSLTVRDYALTCGDVWLRSRGQTWELKWPVASVRAQLAALRARRDAGDATSPPDQFEEHTSLPHIVAALAGMGVHVVWGGGADDGAEFARALEAAGLRPFVSVVTTRTRYALDAQRVASGDVVPGGASGSGCGCPALPDPIPVSLRLGVDVDEVHYAEMEEWEAEKRHDAASLHDPDRFRFRLAEVEVVLPLPPTIASPTRARDEALALADALIRTTCARFGIADGCGQDPRARAGAGEAGEEGAGEDTAPPRVPGKVLAFLSRFDGQRYEALRAAGLLAIRLGEVIPASAGL